MPPPLKRRREIIDLTTDDERPFSDEEIRHLELTLIDLPNELLIQIMKERTADEYIKLLQTSHTLMRRFEPLNNTMFSFYLEKDFNEKIPPSLDARTAYLIRRVPPKVRYVSIYKQTNEDEYPLFQDQFFIKTKPQISHRIQAAEVLKRNYAYILEEEEHYNEHNNDEVVYEVRISEPITGDRLYPYVKWYENKFTTIIDRLLSDIE